MTTTTTHPYPSTLEFWKKQRQALLTDIKGIEAAIPDKEEQIVGAIALALADFSGTEEHPEARPIWEHLYKRRLGLAQRIKTLITELEKYRVNPFQKDKHAIGWIAWEEEARDITKDIARLREMLVTYDIGRKKGRVEKIGLPILIFDLDVITEHHDGRGLTLSKPDIRGVAALCRKAGLNPTTDQIKNTIRRLWKLKAELRKVKR